MTVRPDLAREITRAARQQRAFLARRDALIVQALNEGGGVREVAALAELTHPTVLNISKREDGK